MGDDRGYATLGKLLEAIVVMALIGTFVVYGNPGQNGSTTAGPANMATLDTLH
jgi:hypothetical protein